MPSDLIAQEIAKRLAARTTRRSALGRISRFLLSLVGVNILALGPLNRAYAAFVPPPQWCGVFGKPCPACAGGSETECPSGCHQGDAYWEWCCPDPNGTQNSMMQYWDCCTNGTAPDCGAVTIETHGKDCDRDGDAWCGNYLYYCCSIIVNTSIPC